MPGGRRREAESELAPDRAAVRRPPSVAAVPPSLHSAAGVLELQRTIGNRAVWRLACGSALQPKLQVGPAGDTFEREADEVADDVMRNLAATVAPRPRDGVVTRSVADGVVGLEGGPVGSDAEAAIQRNRGNGSPLPETLRRRMEGSFGADFSGVRVHSGPSADGLNRSMQSHAFTVGGDIFFARDQYRPQTTSGQRLLAHELTHTIQQGASASHAHTAGPEEDGSP
ncbi:MAG TPA: DUF4157 domain-containing protein [Acidimicrobiales bacterium]|nr:DUF4157 domain-containing protein [Acidimicrobiales bacterium]